MQDTRIEDWFKDQSKALRPMSPIKLFFVKLFLGGY